MFENIPAEMRSFNQWIVWRKEEIQDGKPTKVPYCPHTGKHASCNDPSTWATFEQACAAAPMYSGIGFVLTDNDPYTFIDLDEPKASVSESDRQQALDRQLKVYNEFESYAERSPSGRGLHIIVKGRVERGRKRSFIELYSTLRFMTMTGDVYRQAPIVDHNELLNVLWRQMGGNASTHTYEGTDVETHTDEQIYEMAASAVNGQKFIDLFEGRWQDHYNDGDTGKVSCNEADFALVNIIAFYTQNRMQITRMFRNSALGQRKKALRADYVEYMLNRAFDRMLPPVDVDGLRIQLEEALLSSKPVANVAIPSGGCNTPPISEECLKNGLRNLPCEPTFSPTPTLTPRQKAPKQPEAANYDVPPGLVGEIARFFYEAAPRPVAEIALAGAIGLMAGICGRAFNVSGTGLNQYVLLLAPTGTGKEAIGSGIDKVMAAVQRTVPAAIEFVGPAEIASPQALIKYMAKTAPSFVSLVGEYGLKLQQMSAYNADTNQIGLRRMLLDLYNKSGEGKVLRPTIYSNRDNNTEPVLSPAFTLLGESTPEEFYKALNESMIASGLLPRFTCIEYHGHRPPLNKQHTSAVPSFQLIDQVSTLCAHALMLSAAHKAVNVDLDSDAKAMFEDFDKFCDHQINAASAEVVRHLWNRAHIKGLKLAALLAVGVNPYVPVITRELGDWAVKLVCNDIYNMLHKFETGAIGADTEETNQLEELRKVIKHYVNAEWADIEKYKVTTPPLFADKIITYSYLNKKLVSTAAFRKDKFGATKAIYRALETLKNNGDLREIGGKQLAEKYSYSGKCYIIANIKAFV